MEVTRLRFKGNGSGVKYLDLSRALTDACRRLHRQKQIYTVAGGYYVDSNGSRINLNTAYNGWVQKAAINRGFRYWRKQAAKTIQNAEGAQPGKWSDYKILLDHIHTDTLTMDPVDAGDNNFHVGTSPEWNYATLISEDPDGPVQPGDPNGFELCIVGAQTDTAPGQQHGRVGLIQSWFQSRPQLNLEEPNDLPDYTDPLQNLFDAGDSDDDRLLNLQSENDSAPYDEDTTWGNQQRAKGGAPAQDGENLQRQSVAFTSDANPVAPVHGFQALCGLVQLDVVGNPGAWELVLDVVNKGESF